MDDFSKYYTRISNNLKKEKKFEDAIEFVDKAKKIKEDEESREFWYVRGRNFCEIGDYEKALDCFDKDLKLNQKSYDTFFIKGKILFLLKKYDQAVECYNKAAEEYNQKFLQNLKKTDQMKKIRKFEKALIYADSTSKTSLGSEFWYSKGQALLLLNKYGESRACFLKALESDNNNSKTLYFLAKLELLDGNKNECISILKKLCMLDSASSEKLSVDSDFDVLHENKEFRILIGFGPF